MPVSHTSLCHRRKPNSVQHVLFAKFAERHPVQLKCYAIYSHVALFSLIILTGRSSLTLHANMQRSRSTASLQGTLGLFNDTTPIPATFLLVPSISSKTFPGNSITSQFRTKSKISETGCVPEIDQNLFAPKIVHRERKSRQFLFPELNSETRQCSAVQCWTALANLTLNLPFSTYRALDHFLFFPKSLCISTAAFLRTPKLPEPTAVVLSGTADTVMVVQRFRAALFLNWPYRFIIDHDLNTARTTANLLSFGPLPVLMWHKTKNNTKKPVCGPQNHLNFDTNLALSQQTHRVNRSVLQNDRRK